MTNYSICVFPGDGIGSEVTECSLEVLTSLQKFGGITRYYTELNKIFNKNENIKSKIIAPIHQNYYLKNNKYNERFNIYLNRYPKYTKTFVENSFLRESALFPSSILSK